MPAGVQAAALYALGPDYLYVFESNGGVGPVPASAAPALDGTLASRLALAYNGKAAKGTTVYDIATREAIGSGAQGDGGGRLHATLPPGCSVCVTHTIRHTFNTVGGFSLLCPLFGQLDQAVTPLPGETAVYDVAASDSQLSTLLGLLGDLVRGSPANQEALERSDGCEVRLLASQVVATAATATLRVHARRCWRCCCARSRRDT